jgi:hypothetical protein
MGARATARLAPVVDPVVVRWRALRARHEVRRRGRAIRRAGRAHGGDLHRVTTGPRDFLADPDAPIVVSVVRDEALRLPAMLDHYRALGFAGFLFVDNGSTDEGPELLADQDDVVLFATDASYAAAGCGVAWQQHLLAEHARDRWALIADADEQLVFPGDAERGIRGLIERAEARGDASVMAPLIDVYPAGPLRVARYRAGEPFLSVADRFDGPERHFLRWVPSGPGAPYVQIRGGPRHRRMGFALGESPLLTKVPLARRARGIELESAHLVHPPRANAPSTFAALLHFKYLHDFDARARWGAGSGEHWHDGYEYRRYVRALEHEPDLDLSYAGSRRYRGADSLEWLWRAIRHVARARTRHFVSAAAIHAAGAPAAPDPRGVLSEGRRPPRGTRPSAPPA